MKQWETEKFAYHNKILFNVHLTCIFSKEAQSWCANFLGAFEAPMHYTNKK